MPSLGAGDVRIFDQCALLSMMDWRNPDCFHRQFDLFLPQSSLATQQIDTTEVGAHTRRCGLRKLISVFARRCQSATIVFLYAE